MIPAYADATVTLYAGDCLDILRELPDASVDAVVTDPPYNLSFMGKTWDSFGSKGIDQASNYVAPGYQLGGEKNGYLKGRGATIAESSASNPAFGDWCQLWTAECLRVLKPGGHLLAFGGTRTWHRLACAVEDAGFEVRDSIAWMYGSGFPKSLDVSKAIDKAAGAEREVVGEKVRPYTAPREGMMTRKGRGEAGYRPTDGAPSVMERANADGYATTPITAPATPDAARWQGWGTALKPAFEPIVVARKPLGAGTVAANVLAHGTGALNVDGCRVGMSEQEYDRLTTWADKYGGTKYADGNTYAKGMGDVQPPNPAGRWPANVVLDESQAAALDEQSGESAPKPTRTGRKGGSNPNPMDWETKHTDQTGTWPGDDGGGASRFFYVAKADASERVRVNGTAHPTVKPLALMRWLVRLVTPPGGTVLEPFAGSGTTVEACILEGFRCIAIEREADYLPLIRQRINRRRDPVAAVKATGDDGGLFDLLDGGAA